MSTDKPSLDELRIERSDDESAQSKAWLGWLVLIGLIIMAVGIWWFKVGRSVEVRVVQVQLPDPAKERIRLNASGYVTARREATVSSKITGKVVEVLIEEGMRVEEGQILSRLDEVNIRASFRVTEAQLDSAKAALKETEVRLDEAIKEQRRFEALATNNVSTQSELDQIEAEVNSRKAQLLKQKADVAVAESQVELWKQQLEDSIIRAPFTGIVTTKNAQPGEMISPVSAGGGFTRTGICTIVDMASLEIEVDVNESYLNRVSVDQPVTATLDAYLDWQIPARVIAIIPTADRQKSTVRVRVAFEELDPRILPDMAVKVAFLRVGNAAPEERYPVVPKSAIQELEGRSVVWLVKDEKATKRIVQHGLARQDQVSVLAGISAGDLVVVEGQEKLREGMAVRVNSR